MKFPEGLQSFLSKTDDSGLKQAEKILRSKTITKQ